MTVITALSQVQATTNSLDISSTGRLAGDLCIFCSFAGNAVANGPPAESLPSGFTRIDPGTMNGTGFGYSQRWTYSYKVLTGSESTLTGNIGTDQAGCAALIFRGAGKNWSTPQSNQWGQGDYNSTQPSPVTVAAGSAQAPLLIIGTVTSFIFDTGDYLTMSPAYDSHIIGAAGGDAASIGWKIYDSAPADNAVGHTASAGEVLGGFYMTQDVPMAQAVM